LFVWPETVAYRSYDDVPEAIASTASEAHQSLSAKARRAAVAMAKATIEATAKHSRPRASEGLDRPGKPDRAQCAVARARIILADHERLIVTYCRQDDTVYVLTPPGEDPQAVLRAARLVLPQNTYEALADHLGVPAAWPLE
jgi:hypothetical protein